MAHHQPGVVQATLSQGNEGRPPARGTDGVLARQQRTTTAPAAATSKAAQPCAR